MGHPSLKHRLQTTHRYHSNRAGYLYQKITKRLASNLMKISSFFLSRQCCMKEWVKHLFVTIEHLRVYMMCMSHLLLVQMLQQKHRRWRSRCVTDFFRLQPSKFNGMNGKRQGSHRTYFQFQNRLSCSSLYTLFSHYTLQSHTTHKYHTTHQSHITHQSHKSFLITVVHELLNEGLQNWALYKYN